MRLSRPLILLLATAVGIAAANLYYAQPIVGLIAKAVGLDPRAAGLVVTFTQVGYGLGVLFLVPLGDIVENKRLILTMLTVAIFGVLGLAFASTALPYFAAALLTGLGAATVQILVPYAAHFAADADRGRVVGTISSGLMLGIMLSRPTASFLTELISWHAVFVLSAALMGLLVLALARFLPKRQPSGHHLPYPRLLFSMLQLFLRTPLLRRRAFYQACLFSAFCLFWTASPLLLTSSVFHISQFGIALFALVGVGGAIAAPFAGRAADRGHSQLATSLSLVAAATSFALGFAFTPGSPAALAALVASALLLDAGVSANLVLGQRAIFGLAPELRSRLNALYIATIFVGGAFGSALSAWSFALGGWHLTAACGLAMPLLALAAFATE